MKVETVSINIIKPYSKNPRNNEKAVEAVIKSITEYGFNVPILLDKNNVIIAGHTRYKALLRMKKEEVQVVYKHDLTPAQVKEYRIADNKASELATWDMDLLIPELRSMDNIGNLDLFFPTMDLSQLMQDQNQAPASPAVKFPTIPAGEGFVPEAPRMPETRQGVPVEADFSKAQAQIDGAARSKGSTPNHIVKIICPECGEEFGLNSDQIAARAIDASNV